MNDNEKRTYQALFLVGVIAFLVISTYGIAQIWAFLSVSREKTEIFNEPKELPEVYTPQIVWQADESSLPRKMEDFTRKLIGRDYVRALYQRNIAILSKDTLLVQDYFTTLAKAKIKTKINRSKDHFIEQIELNHNIKLSFYSADGQIVGFTDTESEHLERVWSKDKKRMIFDYDTSSYQVIMQLEDGYWRIHNMKRIENQIALTDSLKADSLKNENTSFKNEKLEKLKNTKGINYYPKAYPFKDFWINYDSAIVEKDFVIIKKLKFNAVRIFINYEQFGKGNVIPEMMERLSHLMAVAEKNDIGVLLTLFDFNSDFNLFNFTSTDRQLETILTKLKHNKALVAYDLKNEPDIDYNYQDSILVNQWLSFIVKRAKLYDPETPITIGWSTADKANYLADQLDFVSFHFYKKAELLKSDIDQIKRKIKGKPLIVSEYGKSDFQSLIFPIWNPKNLIYSQISSISKTLKKENIPAYFWTLYDFKEVASDVAGRWPWQKEPQKHFGLIYNNGNIKAITNNIITNKDYKSDSFFWNIPKFIYLYIFIGLIFGAIWINKKGIISIYFKLKKKLINRFFKK